MNWRTAIRQTAHAAGTLAAVISYATCLAQVPPRQDHAAIYRGVEQFVRTQTAGSPHAISHAVTPLDTRLALAPCRAMEFFLPPGARLWGASTVGVRCGGDGPWSILVPVQVTVSGTYVVLARAVPPGHVIAPSDLRLQQGDLTQLPAGVLSETDQGIGKIAGNALAAGSALTRDALRAPAVIQQGQTVLLQSSGQGFRVSAEGKALNNAQDGQVTQVRTASGQTVSGIARAGGIVEVVKNIQ